MKDILLVVPALDGPSRKAIELAGVEVNCVGSTKLNDIARGEPVAGYDGAIVDATAVNFTDAMNLCRQLRQRERAVSPIVLILDRYQLDELTFREEIGRAHV